MISFSNEITQNFFDPFLPLCQRGFFSTPNDHTQRHLKKLSDWLLTAKDTLLSRKVKWKGEMQLPLLDEIEQKGGRFKQK